MERSEPALVPQWLKSSGSGGGTLNHQFASSSSHSDDHAPSKFTRNKSTLNINNHDLGRSSVSDRTTSSYFRRSSSNISNGSSRPYSRGHRDRDWAKDIYEKDKSILGDQRRRDYFDALGDILPSRYEKDGLRRSQSMISGKRGETWPRKATGDSINTCQTSQNNGNALVTGSSPLSIVHKATFERDFPSLGAEERQATPESGRVPSPGLSSAIQNLPIGSSVVIGGDGWTSALAEVPVIVAGNGTSVSSVQQGLPAISVSTASSTTTGLNMAETVAQGPSRTPTSPQLSVETQRLEEIAIKQSRQLIPVTPSMPKALVRKALNSSEKAKPKVGPQPISSSHSVNHSPRGALVKSDISKTTAAGKLHVLKPARERNGVSPSNKDSLSPTGSGKFPNGLLAVPPSVVASAPLRSSSNKPLLASVEKRLTSQAQSRIDFFNLVRKKSMTNSSSSIADPGSAMPPSALDKPGENENSAAPVTYQGREAPLLDSSGRDNLTENKGGLARNEGPQQSHGDVKNNSSSDTILCSEEEEAAFLRSLGWDENAGEDEGLTEEEISAFYRDFSKYINSRPSSKLLQGMKPRFLVLQNSQTGRIGGVSSGLNSSDPKLDF